MSILIVLAVVLAIAGIAGSVIPALPGPPLSWAGLLLVYVAGQNGSAAGSLSLTALLVWLAVTVIVTVLDYVVPAGITRLAGGHRAASVGAVIGLFVGMFIPPVGILLGSIAGAVLGELLVTDQGLLPAFKAGAGAFLGFLLGTGLKLICSGLMAWQIVKYSFFG
ncbi:MAG: DUF456 domain-containing protein [Bacteroidales bacterium]|nr:DUF456 domain-containing protein [Bacteroidales bacterium]